MTLEDFAEYVNTSIKMEYTDGLYVCYMEGAHVKVGNMLFSTFGQSGTPEDAREDFILSISGRVLVFNPDSNERLNIPVPLDLS